MKLPEFEVNDKTIFWGGAITMYAYPLIGWAIMALFAPNVNMADLVFRGLPWHHQIGLGIVYGLAAYLVIHVFIFSKWLGELSQGISMIARRLNWVQIVFLSIAAGVGEELLFRVAIQHFLGIWPTAILFVAIHGYLTLFDERVLSYGLFMVIVSAGFGYLHIAYGITTAIVAHTFIDLFIFIAVKRTPETFFQSKEEKNR